MRASALVDSTVGRSNGARDDNSGAARRRRSPLAAGRGKPTVHRSKCSAQCFLWSPAALPYAYPKWSAALGSGWRGDTGEGWTSMSTLKQYQADIAFRMRRGDTFASVEDEVIDPSPLSDREKAALWLFGWSFVNWRRQRREAAAHIDLLDAEDVAPAPARMPVAALSVVR
jgi:hypothetical protein